MAGNSDDFTDLDNQLDDITQNEKLHVEPMFSPFVCPLTRQVMRDPVSIENGNTFEREAIEKWFKECKESGRKPICPLTLEDLQTTNLNPSIALRNTIQEWTARNEAAQLDGARRSLSTGSSEKDILQALSYVEYISKESRLNKNAVHNPEIVHSIVEMLKNMSRNVRCKALETLRVVAEQDSDVKEMMAEGDTVRSIVKFLSEQSSGQEKEQAISLLYELSNSQNLAEKIGSTNGAILFLVGMTSSKSENILTVEKAHKTLDNLASNEENVRLMAESGRLLPLLTLLLEGSSETKLSMASFLGELSLNNEVKVQVAESVGPALVTLMRSDDLRSREASLKALNQISSYDASATVLIEAGILPPLVKDLLDVGGAKLLPMRLKEISATILSNVVNSGYDIDSIVIGSENQTLVSEDTLHCLLRLISNTGPSIECKLLQVLVGLTSNPNIVKKVVGAIKSSGATINLVQFIEERELRLAAVKLLHNLSRFMGNELADALLAAGQLVPLLKIISENNGITEEQAEAAGLLAELPETDLELTQQLLKEDAFRPFISRIKRIKLGEARGGRFMTPFLEGLVRSLARLTYVLAEDQEILAFCRDEKLGWLFTDLLQVTGTHNVLIASAWALNNLSLESKNLSKRPNLPPLGMFASIFACFSKPPEILGICHVHSGVCSVDTFCLVEGRAVEQLVALLDHTNNHVVEASLAALSTLLDDEVNTEGGVIVLQEVDGIKPIFDILDEKRTEELRKRAVWLVERILRIDQIAFDSSQDQRIGTALVDAFQHADNRTRQIAERALKHIDRIPNFSGIFAING